MIELILLGLILDVAGAFVIILPDIPWVNRRLCTGKLRHALEKLETEVILNSNSTGFQDLSYEIEDLTDKEIPSNTESIASKVTGTIAGATVQPRPLIPLNEEDNPGENPEDWSNYEEWQDTLLSHYRYPLERRIRRKEAQIRAIGFCILAAGFSLQIAGNML